MTIERFRASRREVSDLGASIGDDGLAGIPGFTYLGVLYIERYGDGYHLLIGRHTEVGSDLDAFEQRLFDFAKSEGYVED